jgi:hypothetical protein
MNARTRSSSIFARNAAWHTALVWTTQTRTVIVDSSDDFVGQPVAENRSWPAAVQRRGVFGEKCGLFDWCEFGGWNRHDRERSPLFGLNG